MSLCVAGGQSEKIFASTDPTGGARAWTNTPICQQTTPCISEQLFAHDDQGTRVIDTAPPGQGKSIANVTPAANSLTLNWTHDTAQRQLQLR